MAGLDKIAQGVALGTAGYALFKALTKGAEAPWTNRPIVKFAGEQDLRAKLQVPETALESPLLNQNIRSSKAIIFPFTPQISFETSASYASANPVHSNYTVYSYKNSAVGAINLTAKFVVQNDLDASYYLSTLHLLRSLTKMKIGLEPDAGAPPPVCRLSAYGDFMLKNVPVVVSSFRTELTDTVDYYRVTEQAASTSYTVDYFGANSVPTVSQFVLTLLPMYARSEQLAYRTDQFLSGTLKGQGYL